MCKVCASESSSLETAKEESLLLSKSHYSHRKGTRSDHPQHTHSWPVCSVGPPHPSLLSRPLQRSCGGCWMEAVELSPSTWLPQAKLLLPAQRGISASACWKAQGGQGTGHPSLTHRWCSESLGRSGRGSCSIKSTLQMGGSGEGDGGGGDGVKILFSLAF